MTVVSLKPASPSPSCFHMDEHGKRFVRKAADILFLQCNIEYGDGGIGTRLNRLRSNKFVNNFSFFNDFYDSTHSCHPAYPSHVVHPPVYVAPYWLRAID